MFTRAIVRPPALNFADGLTTADLGQPDLSLALAQHVGYCAALEMCGLKLTHLKADARFPDSTFVEDAAILTPHCAILTRPGAESRKGEVETIREVISSFYTKVVQIEAPGTLDGGDICDAEGHFFIGLSERTNEAGGRQLADFLAREGYTASFIPVIGIPGILHLKSGIAYLGDNNLVLIDAFVGMKAFEGYNIVRVAPEEMYAANCVRINDHIIMPQGFPKLQKSLMDLGYHVIPLGMSEFQKMDGGLSCLSLRF